MQLEVRGLTKRFEEITAVDKISFAVNTGEFLTLLGPSGCGKTTTLRCIAGLEKPDQGTITIGGRVVIGPGTFVPPEERGLGMVFQSYAIWPHMTVFDNVAYGLKTARRSFPKAEIKEKVRQVLKLVQLEGLEGRPATKLSGGQQQRVAVARSLIYNPPLLLFDEPLSNLDAKLRNTMRFELKELQRRIGVTSVYVTHDQEEALVISDRVIIMDHGLIQQAGTPREIYHHPANKFVADFLGRTNLISGRVVRTDEVEKRVLTRADFGVDLLCPLEDALREGDSVLVSVRPEKIELFKEQGVGEANWLEGQVEKRVFLGNYFQYDVEVNGFVFTIFSFNGAFSEAERVMLRIDIENCVILPTP